MMLRLGCALAGALLLSIPAAAQPAAPAPAPAGPPSCRPQSVFTAPATYRSVEQLPDGRITFRLCAPDAGKVMVTSADIGEAVPMGFPPGTPRGLPMTRDAMGLWTATTATPVAPDTYRYDFEVDGVKVPDPQATRFSEERVGTNSVFEATGPAGAFQSWSKDVPHGAVSTIDYWSTALGGRRRAHVYTPPGYMNGSQRYPVLYLVHGAGDSDDSWTANGHANLILDNLIAAGKARPMIIVMPFGHTPDRPGADMLVNTDFRDDLFKDLIPYVERTFRTLPGADNRAMAGLSMGGAHTIYNGLTHPETFHWIGVFSMGLGMQNNTQQITDYERQYGAALDRGSREFRLVYYAIGDDDFLQATVAPTRAILDRHKVRYVFHPSPGGHTWINWRRYLDDFAPRLFR